MKQFFAFVVLVVFSNDSSAQLNFKPVLKTSYSYMQPFNNYYGYDLSLAAGVCIKDQTFLLVQVSYLKNHLDNEFDNSEPFQMLTTSLSTSYRFLKKKHIVSPVLELDAGLNVWSNAEGLYVDNNYIIQDIKDIGDSKFYRNSIIGKTKLLVNVNLKSVDINIGASYNTYFFHLSGAKYGKVYSLESGIGFEAQVLYTFPMKKQAAKKAQE